MNKKPHLAWEIYINMETSNESLSLLNLIANDCYKMGQFYYSAKAFDVLERLDPDPEFWEGKRGAAIGVFQMVVAGQENKERLIEVIGTTAQDREAGRERWRFYRDRGYPLHTHDLSADSSTAA